MIEKAVETIASGSAHRVVKVPGYVDSPRAGSRLAIKPWHTLLAWLIGAIVLWIYYAPEETKAWVYYGAAGALGVVALLELLRRQRHGDPFDWDVPNAEPLAELEEETNALIETEAESASGSVWPWLATGLFFLLCLLIWQGAVAGLALVLFGVPVRWLCSGCKPLKETDWILAPFLGIAIILPILQGLVYLDVPVGVSWPYLWCAIIPLWGWFLWSGHLGVSLARFPAAPYSAAMAVFLIQGLGIILLGAQLYLPAGPDALNYVEMGQFLHDDPFSTAPTNLDHRFYLHVVTHESLKLQRIGQSVLHAFFMGTTFSDARTTFQPTLTMALSLGVLALYLVSRRLGCARGLALAIGMTACLLPGITLLYMASYLSHGFGIWLTVLFPVLLDRLNRKQSLEHLVLASLWFSGIAAVYTEFMPIVFGIMMLSLGVMMLSGPNRLRVFLCYVGVVLSFVIINPGLIQTLPNVFNAIQTYKNAGPYPAKDLAWYWAGKGNWYDLGPEWVTVVMMSYAAAAATLGCTGLLRGPMAILCTGFRHWRRPAVGAYFALAIGVAALGFLPFLVIIRGRADNAYMFIKLLITSIPIHALGIGLLARPLWRNAESSPSSDLPLGTALWQRGAAPSVTLGSAFGCALVAVIFALGTKATISRLHDSTTLQDARYDYWDYKGLYLMKPETNELMTKLASLSDEDILFAFGDTDSADFNAFYNCWAAYAARHNRIWLSAPYYMEQYKPNADAEGIQGMDSFLDVNSFPWDGLVLTSHGYGCLTEVPENANVVWSHDQYQLWRPRNRTWAIPLRFLNFPRLEKEDGQWLFWVGQDFTYLEFYAANAGTLEVSAEIARGYDLPMVPEIVLHVAPERGSAADVLVQDREETVRLSVSAGKNILCFSVPALFTGSTDGEDEAIKAYVKVKNLRLKLTPP